MKKIYFLLVFAIIFGFAVANKASGQNGCDVCQQPSFCYTFTLSIPNLPPPCNQAEATFCYQCGITANWIHIDVTELSYEWECNQYDDQIWDALHNWVLYHIQDLCGLGNCNEPPPKEVHITYPMCGELRCEGTPRRYFFKAHPGACDKRCETVYQWCWDLQQNKPIFNLLSAQVINPEVDCGLYEEPPDCNPGTNPWRIECRNLEPNCPRNP